MKSLGIILEVVGAFYFHLILLSVSVTAQPFKFEEIAAKVGLKSGGETYCVAWGDYDNDGDEDILFSNGLVLQAQPIRLYEYIAAADSFVAVTNQSGINQNRFQGGAAWGDFDNDGNLDLFIGDVSGRNKLYHNNGNKTFSEIGTPFSLASGGVAWADYNRDGYLDVAIPSLTPVGSQLFRNHGDYRFEDVARIAGAKSLGANSVAIWGDYDNDGDPDLYIGRGTVDAVANFTNQLYRNNGDGTFAEVGQAAGVDDRGATLHASWIDYDNDGFLDLYVANGNWVRKELTIDRLYHNNKDGTFTDRAITAGLRGGNLPDTLVTRNGLWGDFDNDGYLDLFISTESFDRIDGSKRNYFYQNKGNGTFELITNFDSNVVGSIVTFIGPATAADFNRDGFLDIFIPGFTNARENRFFMNKPNNNHWLVIKLEGTSSNASAIGARVGVITGNLRQIREVEGGSRGQNSLPVEFGLGSRSKVDSVIVCWPSGQVDIKTNLQADDYLTIRETHLPPFFVDVTTGELENLRRGQAAAWGDFNNDDKLDLYVVNGASTDPQAQVDRLYQNLGNGKFSLVSSDLMPHFNEPSVGAAWCDYDNDGDLDLYVTGDNVPCRLFKNQLTERGQAGFIEVANAAGVAYIGKALSGLWVDYDQDGYLDLFVSDQESKNRLYHNQGDGTFREAADSAGVALDVGGNHRAAWADYDNDGDLDLYVNLPSGQNRLYRNNGDGRFTDVAAVVGVAGELGDISSGIAWGDYDNDGNVDLFVHGKARSRLYRNEGQGFFEEVAESAHLLLRDSNGESASWIDYDRDGYLDLYVANFLSANILFRNNGDGTFSKVKDSGLEEVSASGEAAWADYDGDGDVDVYVPRSNVDRGDRSILYRNDLSSANHWLIVKTVGSRRNGSGFSNRSGIGALVVIKTNGSIQMREVEGGANQSQHSLPVEFGFGPKVTQVDTLFIRWPNGLTKTLLNVTTDQFLAIPETVPQLKADKDSLGFGALALGKTAIQVFTLRNRGDGDLNVKQILVSNKVFSVEREAFRLLQGQAMEIQVRCTPDSAKLELGTLTVLSDDPERTKFAMRLQVVGRDVDPPQIVFDPATLKSPPPREKRPLLIRPIFTDNLRVQSPRLFYRMGGASVFDSTFLSIEDPVRSAYVGKIPAEAVTNRGLEFYFIISDGSNFTTLPADDPQNHPFAVEVDVDNIKKATLQPARKYRMFSMPLRLHDPEIDYEPYDRKQLRVFAWKHGRYVEYKTSDFPQHFTPGEAFFMISRNEIRLETGSGLTVTTSQPFELVLHTGWNMIAVPWNFRVSWAMAEKPDDVWRNLYDYDGGFKLVDILKPGEGYLAHNFNADSIKVRLLPREASAEANPQISEKRALASDEWRLALYAQVGTQWDSTNYLGMLATAAEGWDFHDAPEPPPIGEYVSLSFPHPEWSYAGDYSADYRPVSNRGTYWDFDLWSNLDDPSAELRWSDINTIPEGFEVMLVDKHAGQMVDMRRANQYACFADAVEAKPGAKMREPRFRLIAGRTAFVQEHAQGLFGIPAAFALHESFPNPLTARHGNTVIRYELPKEAHVRLGIFDVLGREVKSLVNGPQPAGYHGVAWDGRDANGQPLASGIYFYRFHAEDFVKVRKLLLLH